MVESLKNSNFSAIFMDRWLLIVIILLLPLQFALNIGENVDLVTTRILIPVVFSLWLVQGMAKKKIWIANRAETWLLLALLFLAAISIFVGLDFSKGIRKTLYLFSIFPVYFVAADLARDSKFRIYAMRAIWASGTLAAVVGLGQFALPFLIGLGPVLKIWRNITPFFLGNSFGKLVAENPSWLVNVSGETWMRAFGFFPDPHMFSFFVSLCFFIGLGYFAWEQNTKWKIIAGTGEALMFFSIIFSFSRGAYLGVIVGGLFFLAVLLIRLENIGKVAIAGAILIFLAAVFFQGTIQSRFASALNFKEGSNAERIKNWRQAAEVTRDYPLSGIGLGNYSAYIDPTSGERSSIYAHNTFLDIAAETGILNGFVFLALILVSFRRNIASKNVLDLGIASGLVYFLIHGIFDTPIWSPQILVIFLVMLALSLPLSSGTKKIKQI
ncbi:MAG: O-antigen ligase family protein [Patescibacteria group bacterium]|nr:O-antigen ligase family protein [Patescibacteria group bacterium]